jgi:hypothetical protein
MKIDEIVRLLEEIAPTVGGWHEIGTALRKQGLETSEHILWKYVFAFEYMYVEEANRDYFERYGPFAPWIEMQGGVFPPPLSTMSKEILDEWAIVLEKVQHPILCSRLADLLWERKRGKRPDLYARKAIDSYLEVAKSKWEELYRAYCLTRALGVSKQINDSERKKIIISSIVDTCDQVLRSGEWKPGISLRLIEALMKLSKSEIPDDVDVLLDKALQVYGKDAWIVENILELMIRQADEEKRKDLQYSQVINWINEAEKSEKGLFQLHSLEHALELARNYGFQDLIDEMRTRIQSITEEDLQLKTITSRIEIPNEIIEKYLNSFIDERGFTESLTRFGSNGPPSGDYKKNIEELEQHIKEFPLQFYITRTVYDDNNVPIRNGHNLDENKEIALAQIEAMNIGIFGNMAPIILERITQKHGLPSIKALTEFFTTPLIPEDIAVNISTAIDWYYKNEFDVATHLLIPRIEAIFRILSRELGLPIIRESVGSTPGGVLQLGSLLTNLQEKLNESWRKYFYNLLVNPIGINLRNRVCHGLIAKAEKDDAALLIHVVCNLRLIRVSKPNEDQEIN